MCTHGVCIVQYTLFFFFFFNDTATTEIYTLSLHDALPISWPGGIISVTRNAPDCVFISDSTVTVSPSTSGRRTEIGRAPRLNSSHANISYAVFCLKKKKKPNHLNDNHISFFLSNSTHLTHDIMSRLEYVHTWSVHRAIYTVLLFFF